MNHIDVTAETFEREVLRSEKPVIVDFWANWCGPCRMIAPVLEEIAAERQDLKVCKINVDEQQELAVRYGIMSIPTLLIFKNGELTEKSVGVVPKERILSLL